MKRASVKLKKFNGVNEEANQAKVKHQTLLREYLELQKDFVSKKRKFQATKQKRENLVAIIKFLRRKRRYLLNFQPMATKLEMDLVDSQNVDTEREMFEGETKRPTDETAVRYEEGGDGRGGEKVDGAASGTKKITKKHFFDDKRLGKKKILWHDQLTLKV